MGQSLSSALWTLESILGPNIDGPVVAFLENPLWNPGEQDEELLPGTSASERTVLSVSSVDLTHQLQEESCSQPESSQSEILPGSSTVSIYENRPVSPSNENIEVPKPKNKKKSKEADREKEQQREENVEEEKVKETPVKEHEAPVREHSTTRLTFRPSVTVVKIEVSDEGPEEGEDGYREDRMFESTDLLDNSWEEYQEHPRRIYPSNSSPYITKYVKKKIKKANKELMKDTYGSKKK